MIAQIAHIIFWIFFLYSILLVSYLFLFSIAGRFFYKTEMETEIKPEKKIAVLVPAYKEDGIIISTAKNLLSQEYPADLYDIYILADSFNPFTLEKLKEMPVHVVEVFFDKSTKTKSLNEGFRQIKMHYDIALICDADNMLKKDFLSKINAAFTEGAKAVQGKRVAKNLDSSFAILDACSEGINNNIFRKGANALHLSSAVIGSGMAFEFETTKEILSKINAVGGFDKPMQLMIVEQNISIKYLDNAIIFDEKVDSSQAFKQQRKRWVSSQFIYLKQFFAPALKQLFLKGNFSYFNLAVLNNVILPRAFLLVIFPLFALLSFFIENIWTSYFLAIWLIYIISLLIALPSDLVNKNLLYALVRLPKAIILMITSLFQMKKANKSFIHTVHTKTEVSNPLFNDHVN